MRIENNVGHVLDAGYLSHCDRGDQDYCDEHCQDEQSYEAFERLDAAGALKWELVAQVTYRLRVGLRPLG